MEGRLIGITGRSTSISGQDTIKTNAWASISIVKGALKELNGIVISGDAQFGHVLVAVLTDGEQIFQHDYFLVQCGVYFIYSSLPVRHLWMLIINRNH
jgi:hypothetical protein